MVEMDYNKKGVINYTEFLAAAVDRKSALTMDNLKFAFHFFDTDGTGTITAENLREAFQR